MNPPATSPSDAVSSHRARVGLAMDGGVGLTVGARWGWTGRPDGMSRAWSGGDIHAAVTDQG